MNGTIDLTPRQATRLLEQAVRARARLDIEPCSWTSGKQLTGTLHRRDGNLMTIDLDNVFSDPALNLIGAFCDVRAALGGHVFVFSTCILDVVDNTPPTKLVMAVPDYVQVSNRRRYERTNATVASPVSLSAGPNATPVAGLIQNVSNEGLAAQFEGVALNDSLLVGDSVVVAFEIAGFDEVYQLPAIVCSKHISGDQSQLSIGLQFDRQTSDASAQASLRRLHATLRELMNDTLPSD